MSNKSVRHTYMGGGSPCKYVRKNVPFCTYFVILYMLGALPYFVACGVDFHYCFITNFYYHFPVSQTLYSLFLYGIIDWIFKNIPLRNGEWGSER